MIKVNKIIPQTVECFDDKNKSLGFLNDFEFNDLRIQILLEGVEGYYAMFNGIRIDINKNGKCSKFPDGFFVLYQSQLMKLIRR